MFHTLFVWRGFALADDPSTGELDRFSLVRDELIRLRSIESRFPKHLEVWKDVEEGRHQPG